MANPIYELHLLFSDWNAQKRANENRGFSEDKEKALAEHERAMTLLVDTRKALSALSGQSKIAERCLTHIPAMTAAILSRSAPWGSANADAKNFDPVMMESLLHASHEVQRIIDDSLKNFPLFTGLFSEIKQNLTHDSTVSAELKSFIVELINSIQSNYDRENLGQGFDLELAMKSLWTALIALQESSEEPGTWSHFASKTKTIVEHVAKYGSGWVALGYTVANSLMLGPAS
jgi:hypothetical protein